MKWKMDVEDNVDILVMICWLIYSIFFKQTNKGLLITIWKIIHFQLNPLLNHQPFKKQTFRQTCFAITSHLFLSILILTSIVFLKWHVKPKKHQNHIVLFYSFVFCKIVFEQKKNVPCTLANKCVWSGSCEPENIPIIQTNKMGFKICGFAQP